MALACAWSIGLRGLEGEVVEIEADLGAGLPGVSLVGLPDAALHESRDRVRAAVVNSGETWPARRITLALSPATLPKQGSGYDLALACAVLAAAGVVPPPALRGTVLLGELALDGRIRDVRGVLPCLLAARRAGVRRAVVPDAALAEAAVVEGLEVLGADNLVDVLAWLRGEPGRLGVAGAPVPRPPLPPEDLADVMGQTQARWATEVAAAGGHNLLLLGPPGSGKTMLARRMVGVLPDLDLDEALQVAAVRSVAGALDPDDALPSTPPFVAPHHSVSVAALVGGGSGLARPGAVSLAHRGVLFLDEVLEFGPRLLETLRTPLEEGEVRLARKDGVVCYPSRFQLVMAANPCPCAPPRAAACTCTAQELRRYRSRLSGPLLDRVDLRVVLTPVTRLGDIDRLPGGEAASTLAHADGPGPEGGEDVEEVGEEDGEEVGEGDGRVGSGRDASAPPEDTATVRARVLAARAAARERWAGTGWRTNADVPGPALRRRHPLPRAVTAELDAHLRTGLVTARGVDRALRVAWTVADLRGAERPEEADVHRAVVLRHLGAAS